MYLFRLFCFGNLDTAESYTRYTRKVLQCGGEDQLDRLCEK